jgi:flagellar hook assembly protein FlgD
VSAQFQVPATGRVLADVHDVTGRRVAVLVDGRMDAGSHRLVWDGRAEDGRECAAGVYFLRLQAGDEERSSKILRLR